MAVNWIDQDKARESEMIQGRDIRTDIRRERKRMREIWRWRGMKEKGSVRELMSLQVMFTSGSLY